ncbi:NUDIX hydrolase [Streptomyces sp. SD11]|uniref:NUDIX hydrolase n=1 Tax=Streptomyces sp. SD11 TaxID=3452209 RepID=UPI003F8CCF41
MGGLIAGAVVARQGEVLLIRRARPVGSLIWSFPAGKVEPGESVTDAAAREALEETGVSVAPVVALGSRVHPVTGWRVVYIACRLLGGVARVASSREVAEAAWVPVGELGGYVTGGFYPPVRAYLDRALVR